MTTFGISPEELAGISSKWRDEAGRISGTQWSAFGQAAGSGSDVLAAIRDSAAPAEQATDSIGERFSTLAQKVDTFGANAVAEDANMGTAIDELPQR